MCAPESRTEISPELLKCASAVCTAQSFVHTRSSLKTTLPRCSLGPEKTYALVSCLSLRANPEMDRSCQVSE